MHSREHVAAWTAPGGTGAAPLDRVLQGASFAMLILGADRRIELANDRARELLLVAGCPTPDGSHLSTVVQPELRSSLEGIVAAVLRERRRVEADRVRGPADRVIDVVGYPVDDDGVARHVVVVANDVTERLALESQLIQSSKLATIGELAAGVAHEINNPVAFVQSNLRSLDRYWQKVLEFLRGAEAVFARAREAADPELARLAHGLDEVRAALKLDAVVEDLPAAISESLDGTARIQKIVQDLKSFARPDDARFRAVDLNEVVERALRLVSNEAKYVAEVECALGDVPPARGNASQLSQVLVNLLMNAIQAIAGHGKIVVRTYAVGETVCVEVEDTGAGIPPEALPRIFDPFFTTKPPGAGTGLGLSVSYGIVERHGGRILVETELGRGSRFTVELPRAAADGSAESEAMP